MHGEHAGDAFHHHLARLVLALADQRDARLRVGERGPAHPFGAGAGLAGAAPAQDQPGGPVFAAVGAFGRQLVFDRDRLEIGADGVNPMRRLSQEELRQRRFADFQ